MSTTTGPNRWLGSLPKIGIRRLPVEWIFADLAIGGVAEAAACAEEFARADVGLSLMLTF